MERGRAAYAPLHGTRDDRRPRDRPHRDVRRRPRLVRRLTARVVCAARPATTLTHTPFTGAPLAVPAGVHPGRRARRRTRAPAPRSARGPGCPWSTASGSCCASTTSCSTGRPRCSTSSSSRPARPGCTPSRRSPTSRWSAGTTAAGPPATCGRDGGWAPFPVLTRSVELRHPKGVVGIVSPWNYPLTLAVTDAIPALLAGNAVVLRPDQQTALTALRAVELLVEAGLPERGAAGRARRRARDRPGGRRRRRLRLLHRLDRDRPRGGRSVPPRRLVGCSLELGGKNADVRRRATPTSTAPPRAPCAPASPRPASCASRSSGCTCTRTSPTSSSAAFVRPGPGDAARRGAATTAPTWARLCSAGAAGDGSRAHVDDAVAKGATVLAGGGARPDIGPFFYEPTMLDGRHRGDGLPRRGDLRPGRVGLPRARRRRGRRAGQRHATYGLNASVWTRDVRARPPGRRPRSRPARSTSTRATPRRGAASPRRWAA